MVKLEGRSGVLHSFAEAETSPSSHELSEHNDLIIESVADVLDSVATVTEVLALYAKAQDVGAGEITLEAPSIDDGAKKLAAEDRIQLMRN